MSKLEKENLSKSKKVDSTTQTSDIKSGETTKKTKNENDKGGTHCPEKINGEKNDKKMKESGLITALDNTKAITQT